jgi:hypothetical protein
MSSTSNLQSLLAYVFRPAYTFSNGTFTTTINLSNIDKFTANTVTYQVLYIGDALSNVYIGSNAGNAPAIVSNCNAYSNTAIGVLAANALSNSTNSVFVGYQAGLGATSNSSIVSIGMNSGYQLSNATNSILIGASNSYNLSAISNTISIGVGGGGVGNSNIYLGRSTGAGMTGSGNVFLGNALNVASGVSATLSNTLLIGTGSNILVTGNFSNGALTVGTSNPSAVSVSNINTYGWGGSNQGNGYGFLALDVAGWTRVSSGLTIGKDPYNPVTSTGKFEFDVSGHARVTDGYSVMTMSNYYSNSAVGATGLSNNTVFSVAPVAGSTGTVAVNFGGPLTLTSGNLSLSTGSLSIPNGSAVVSGTIQSSGYYSVQGTASVANGTPVYLSSFGLKPGVIMGMVVDPIGNYCYTASFLITSTSPSTVYGPYATAGTPSVFITIENTSPVTVQTIRLAHSLGSAGYTIVFQYSFTLFPVA